jgi:hypothetical protein
MGRVRVQEGTMEVEEAMDITERVGQYKFMLANFLFFSIHLSLYSTALE